jgi:hypothetical protein
MMSLDNIDSEIRRKASNNAFVLLALLPKVKFPDVKDRELNRTLRDRVLHKCLRIVLRPLCIISKNGKEMIDPRGQLRMCYTVLSMYLVDLMEALSLVGVTSRRSPVTTAKSHQLGDSFRHKRRWLRATKKVINQVASHFDPVLEIKEFSKKAAEKGLTGVVNLFWDDWNHCEPSVAYTFDILHSGHKFWADHMLQWCIRAIGPAEIDARFAALPQQIGLRHFSKGVVGLKKTGGRDHRDMQRFILSVIDGAVPTRFAGLIRAHLDYFYIAQCAEVSEDDMIEILDLLQEFHAKKDVVHTKGFRITEGFSIPKLELQHHIVPTIMATGNLLGSSTDTPERAHIDFVKGPYRMTNHKDYYPQMTSRLDMVERIRHFDLATGLHDLEERCDQPDQDSTDLRTIENLCGPKREDYTDYFAVLRGLENFGRQTSYKQTRTFSTHSFTVIHLNRDASISSISIDEASQKFGLRDLRSAMNDYYHYLSNPNEDASRGPALRRTARSSSQATTLPFENIRIWYTIKVQTKSLTEPGKTSRPRTLCAEPKSTESGWPYGRYDCALFINDLEAPFKGKANLRGGVLTFQCSC